MPAEATHHATRHGSSGLGSMLGSHIKPGIGAILE
jgi:hypothetical protein